MREVLLLSFLPFFLLLLYFGYLHNKPINKLCSHRLKDDKERDAFTSATDGEPFSVSLLSDQDERVLFRINRLRVVV